MPYTLFEQTPLPSSEGRFIPAINGQGKPTFRADESVELQVGLEYYYWHHEPAGLGPASPSRMVSESASAELYVTDQRVIWVTEPKRPAPKKKLFGRGTSEPPAMSCLAGCVPLNCVSLVALEPDPKNEIGGLLALAAYEGNPLQGTMHLVRLGLQLDRRDAVNFLSDLAQFVDEVSHPAARLDEPLESPNGALQYMFTGYVDLDGRTTVS